MAESKPNDLEAGEVKQATVGARKLADAMPRLILEARRVATTVIHGLHGRRRAGPGENFWQYRRFVSGEAAQNVDWRRSARDDHLYVREREWEASHTVWIWPDRSPSMAFTSELSDDSKLERALVIAFALAEVLVQGGERVGVPGLPSPDGKPKCHRKDGRGHSARSDRTREPAAVVRAFAIVGSRNAVGFVVPDR